MGVGPFWFYWHLSNWNDLACTLVLYPFLFSIWTNFPSAACNESKQYGVLRKDAKKMVVAHFSLPIPSTVSPLLCRLLRLKYSITATENKCNFIQLSVYKFRKHIMNVLKRKIKPAINKKIINHCKSWIITKGTCDWRINHSWEITEKVRYVEE